MSLDVIAAEVGVAKQTLLYWFPSKDELVQAVLVAAAHGAVGGDRRRGARRDRRSAGPHRGRRSAPSSAPPCAGRRCSGLIREVSRLPPAAGDRLTSRARARSSTARWRTCSTRWTPAACAAPIPRLVASLCYATVTGIATEPEALRVVGWQPTAAGLRHLRDELLAFLRAALAP